MLTQQKLNDFLNALHKRLMDRGVDFNLNIEQSMMGNEVIITIDSNKGIDRYALRWNNTSVWFIRYWFGV